MHFSIPQQIMRVPIGVIQFIPTTNPTISIKSFLAVGNRIMACHNSCFLSACKSPIRKLTKASVDSTWPSVNRMFIVKVELRHGDGSDVSAQIMSTLLLVVAHRTCASLLWDGLRLQTLSVS